MAIQTDIKPEGFLGKIKEAFTNELKESLEKVYEEKKQEMIEKLEEEKSDTIAKTIVKLSHWINYREFSDRLVIEVKKDKVKENQS